MMTVLREIKFRGKEVNTDVWVFGGYEDFMPRKLGKIREPNQGLVFAVDPATVGQFTGLYDCEGKEIYEGDVVERDNSYFHKTCPTLSKTTIGVVKWCDGEFIVTGSYKLFSSSNKFPIRVIGNVHDNPQLPETAYDQSD